MVLDALQIVLTVMLITALGYVLALKNKFDDNSAKLFSFLVTSVALPCVILYNLLSYYDRDKLLSAVAPALVPLAAMIIVYLISKAACAVFKVPRQKRGVFSAMSTFSNTLFVGIPINVALFGEAAIPPVILYYFAQTILFWTVGIAGIIVDGSPGHKTFSAGGLKRLITLPLITFFITCLLILVEFTPPAFLNDAFRLIAGIVTPISLFFTGIIIYKMGLKNVRIDKATLLMIAGRFIISPAVLIGLTFIFPIGDQMTRNVFIIQSAMPIMTQTALLAKSHGADEGFASVGTITTTALSIVFIPLYAYICTVI